MPPCAEPPPATRGGSRGYTPAMRQSQLALAAAGAPGVVASVSSLRRWATHGTGRRRKRGGASSTSLRGEEELLLVLCRLAWPKATADQISAYLARTSASGWIYSRMAITWCEQRLGLTRKRGSITALQALTPFHQARRHNFWNLPHPAGIDGTPRASLIDIDEAGIGLEQVLVTWPEVGAFVLFVLERQFHRLHGSFGGEV